MHLCNNYTSDNLREDYERKQINSKIQTATLWKRVENEQSSICISKSDSIPHPFFHLLQEAAQNHPCPIHVTLLQSQFQHYVSRFPNTYHNLH